LLSRTSGLGGGFEFFIWRGRVPHKPRGAQAGSAHIHTNKDRFAHVSDFSMAGHDYIQEWFWMQMGADYLWPINLAFILGPVSASTSSPPTQFLHNCGLHCQHENYPFTLHRHQSG
jgi:hypothetical protein